MRLRLFIILGLMLVIAGCGDDDGAVTTTTEGSASTTTQATTTTATAATTTTTQAPATTTTTAAPTTTAVEDTIEFSGTEDFTSEPFPLAEASGHYEMKVALGGSSSCLLSVELHEATLAGRYWWWGYYGIKTETTSIEVSPDIQYWLLADVKGAADVAGTTCTWSVTLTPAP